MGATQVRTHNVADGSINRDDLDITTPGKAVIRKIVQGTGVSISSTGSDSGTGDVTISIGQPVGTNNNVSFNSVLLGAATGGELLVWGGTGDKGIRKITDQGGILIRSDSSMILHAGDNGITLVSDLGIVAGTTNEHLYLTSDGSVYIITNRQTSYATSKTFSFDANGVMWSSAGLAVNGAKFIDSSRNLTNINSITMAGNLTLGVATGTLGYWVQVHDSANDRLYMGFSGSQGGEIQFYANGTANGLTQRFYSNGNVVFTGSLSCVDITSSGKISWGTGSFSGNGNIYNTATDGTVFVSKTGSSTDFVLANGAGGTVFDIPTGTVNIRFSGTITSGAITSSALIRGVAFEINTNADFSINAYYSSGWKYRTNGYAGDFYQTSAGDIVFLTAPSGIAGNAVTFTNRFTILNGGGIKIGGNTITETIAGYLTGGLTDTVVFNTAEGTHTVEINGGIITQWNITI